MRRIERRRAWRGLWIAGLLATTLGLGACGASRESALDKDIDQIGQGKIKGDFEAVVAQADAAWEGRVEKAKLIEALGLYEKAAQVESPELSAEQRRERLIYIYTQLARGYYFLADSHIRLEAEDDEKDDEMMKVFDQGVSAAERLIAVADPVFAKKIKDGGKWQEEVKKADPKAIPGLYWYATNLGKWALLEGVTTILARKDDIKVTMDYIISKDEAYFHGAPHRYFAVYHTKVPLGGGDPPKSKASFERSLSLSPNYFATKVLYAETYATLVQDAALFERLLKEVIEAPADVLPELTPENTLEQRKAKRMLAKKADLFY
jgi:hypothetical protein